MSLQPPKLDNRSVEDILSQLRGSAARHLPEWAPGQASDPGVMLQHTFARLMEIVVERLNRVPEKQLLAFLDAMNVSPLPPVPAAAPLVFALKKDAPPTPVPRGTAAMARTPGGEAPVVFETAEDLVVLPAAITCAYALEPQRGRYGDYTDRLEGGGFTPFIGERVLPDTYFFLEDTLLSMERPEAVELLLNFSKQTAGSDIQVFLNRCRWSCSGEEGPVDLAPTCRVNANRRDYSLVQVVLGGAGMAPVLPVRSGPLGGGRAPQGGRYIRCALEDGGGQAPVELPICSASLRVKGSEQVPAHLFSSSTRLDPEGYFLPFGDRPREGSAFHIHMGELLTMPGAQLRLSMELAKTAISAGKVGHHTRWCDLHWSYYSAEGWRRIETDRDKSTFHGGRLTLVFTCPEDAAPHKVRGEAGHWLRAVLPTGDCGSEAEYEERGGVYTLKPGTGRFVYPMVRAISLSFDCTLPCRTLRQTGHLYTALGEPAPSAATHPELETTAFYLGFDRVFPHQPISLYVDAEGAADGAEEPGDAPPVWAYLAADGWRPLYVNDDTRGLSHSGAIRLRMPPEAVGAALFDPVERYWLRLPRSGSGRLKGIYLNAVPAEHATTVGREALGVSSGSAGQRFALRGTPVLGGQLVWVRESEAPTAAELPETSLEIRQNPVTLEAEHWVLWSEQNSFGASQPSSRHYTLDRATGDIRFGNGARGMVPEKGAAIAVQYRHGGGACGNLPAGAVSKLSATRPGIERVFNPIPAVGGADSESVQDIMDRGPMSLRHRGRGVTLQDIEWLVKEAAGAAVDRIKCLPGTGQQPFALLLLPAAEGLRPLPDGLLAARVRSYLDARLPAALAGGRYGMVGPRYLTVGISAALVPRDPLDGALVRERAVECLHAFLHPRRGGPEGRGWPFGRPVYLSEICALLETVEGVDHTLARTVEIRPAALQRELSLRSNDIRLEATYPAGSLLSLKGAEGDVAQRWLLAEEILTEVLPRTLRVTGLREGDVLSAVCALGFDPTEKAFINRSGMAFPPGSAVHFADGVSTTLRSTLYTGERLRGERLCAPHPQGLAAGASVTLVHPDGLTVTGLRDLPDGGCVAEVHCPSEGVLLRRGAVLECRQSRVRVQLAAAPDGREVVQSGRAVQLYFCAPTLRSGWTLSRPDGPAHAVEIGITMAQAFTDTAYLSPHELCTPGSMDIQIAD
ncbi:MAG: putative baseplate assembly protein [Clostridiales bacterium]|nr:putative baseplate assembly protein [Clostridiales bacterium]